MTKLLLQAPWKAVGKHFESGGDMREVLTAVLTIAALLTLLIVVHYVLGKRSDRTPPNDPQKLFRATLARLDLGVVERDLLRLLTRELRVAQPITLVLSPEVFRAHAGRWSANRRQSGVPLSNDQRAHLDGLCRSLFDEPLRPEIGDDRA